MKLTSDDDNNNNNNEFLMTALSMEAAAAAEFQEEKKEEEDRISDLPDSILSSIISLLPLKEALKSSLVSKRWRSLWRHLTRLGIDDSACMPAACSREERIRQLSGVIQSQRNSFIACCEIYFTRDESLGITNEKKSWIEFLKDEKKLEKLVVQLEIHSLPPEALLSLWPVGFFNGSNLREVEILRDGIPDANPFAGCENLRKLKFNSVRISHRVLAEVVKSCVNLEDLKLVRCLGLARVGIQHEKIKCVGIEGLRLKRLRLVSESLRVLSVSSFSIQSHDLRCPNLVVLNAHKCNSADFIDRFIGLLGSDHFSQGYCWKIKTLRSNFNLANWYDLLSLRFIFRAWACLQRLYIVNKGYEGEPYHTLPYPQSFWEGESTEIMVHHLKVVQIESFTCGEKEMQFVTHLVKNAEVLEELIIRFDHPRVAGIASAKRELLSLPRGSENVKIKFEV
ncbi:OLC1v1023371C1 [Oldenlandia corymbosa var. corymbosa]|uniref:OLC1v1023371C1 n=1 Tax=Oldenlandia corymbosa var. corymbosa TaxID=529605 RepID=A0AAV1BZT6_OLDCO|nr:OLC1v1023371C1 [Oldenlandia corymbosa var. corymbosa]